MSTFVQHQRPGFWQAFWSGLRDLDFLSAFFSWLFLLFSRLAEPLMLLATLYVVAEAGVPAIALSGLHNLAIGIMITAPEIILPGAFVVASRAQEYRRLLYWLCWTFVVLTLVTLVSLFVFHFVGTLLALLMCARCAAAVGYSILMRVMSHRRAGVQSVVYTEQHIQRSEPPKDVAPAVARVRVLGVQTSVEKQSFAWIKHLNETQKEEPIQRKVNTTPPVCEIAVDEPVKANEHRVLPFAVAEHGEKSERVRRVLEANPEASISEIMKSAKVSRGHASQKRSQFLAEQKLSS